MLEDRFLVTGRQFPVGVDGRRALHQAARVADLEVARAHGAEIATVALAWLAAQPTVTAPIASARTTAQLPALLAVADLTLTDADLAKLNEASA